MKTIKMTKDQYLEKHKELVDLLGMDMIEKRIQAETDGLTVYQYGYIFALEKRITELEAEIEKWKAGNKLLYDTAMEQNHEFGLTMQFANELIEKKRRITELEKIIGISARLLYHHMDSCPSDIYGWDHPRTCEIRCEEIDQPAGWVACWREFLMQETADGATQTPLPVSDATQEEEK